jgi:hypothetical protein
LKGATDRRARRIARIDAADDFGGIGRKFEIVANGPPECAVRDDGDPHRFRHKVAPS